MNYNNLEMKWIFEATVSMDSVVIVATLPVYHFIFADGFPPRHIRIKIVLQYQRMHIGPKMCAMQECQETSFSVNIFVICFF